MPVLGALKVSVSVSSDRSSSLFNISKVFGCSFLSFRLSEADIREKFRTKRLNKLQRKRFGKDLSSVKFDGGSSFSMASVASGATEN